MPPIPPCEIKEVVKESLVKEASHFSVWQVGHFPPYMEPTQIARLASLNASQKAAAESLVRAAERSRHELEMSLLELHAAGERRKAAAAQVEEARAGTLGIGGIHEHSATVSYS